MRTKVHTLDMTKGPLAWPILRFSIPLLCSNVLQVLFNMADVAVVGRFAGAAALGSVGSTTMVVALFTGFMLGIGSGVNALTARFLGAHRDEEVNQTVHTSCLVCLLIGLAAMGLCSGLALPMLQLVDTKPELLDGAVLYLQLYGLAMPAVALYNFGSGVLNAAGDTRRPLYILLGAGFLNVCLNVFFVLACGMDVDGVAIASTISHYISALLILVLLFRDREVYRMRLRDLRLNREKAVMLLKLGLPSGLHYSSFAVANLFMQVGINQFDTVMVEGNAAAVNTDSLIYDVTAAFCVACTSFVGQNFGAGEKKRMLKTYWIALGYGLVAIGLVSAGLLLFGRPFLGLFTTESAVVDAGLIRMRIMAASYLLCVPMDVSIAACRGMGKSFWPMMFIFIGCCALRIVWVFTVFAWVGTIGSLYLAYLASWIVTTTAVVVYFAGCFRRVDFTKQDRLPA